MTKGAQKTEKIRTANQPTRESHASVPRNRLPPIVETSSLLHTTKKTSGLSSIKKVEGKLENNESTKSNFG